MYTQIENGREKYPGSTLEYLVTQNIIDSVDATQAELAAANIVSVTAFVGQTPSDGYPYTLEITQQSNGSWTQELKRLEISDQEYQSNTDIQAQAVKANRGRMLVDCDWVVTKSAETGQAVPDAWKTYRQALRDVTSQAGFPWTVTWPDAP
jgi:uridine phosphorylase